MSTTATRLITLILLLQRRPRQKAAKLAEELDVSVRTVHRYVEMLNEMGIPIYSERGPYGGFSLVRGYKMPPLIFTPQEAAAICLGAGLVEEIWGPLYKDAARSAMAKLESLLPDEQRQEVAWARRTLVATGMQRADHTPLAPTLAGLRRAARDHHCIRMRYQSLSHPDPLERVVDPYALLHRWGWWYVIAHCHLRQALRTFRIDRIQELTVLNETFEVPPDFDVLHYLAEDGWPQPTLNVRLRFSPEAAAEALDDRGAWDQVAEQPDGSVVVTFGASSLDWAARVALWRGPAVTVLEPEELRRQVERWARTIAERHQPAEEP